jgi:RHS repeat-associated protein
LNRLLEANYYREGGNYRDSYLERIAYDKNGNIQKILRHGDSDAVDYEFVIDELQYTYDAQNPNLLLKVFDYSNSPQGFKDDGDGISDHENDYKYDTFGNLIKDDNKNIESITYNHLNLPVKIIFHNGNISYLYTATGQKIKKVVSSRETITTDYLGSFQYFNNNLKHIPHAEGYVNVVNGKFKHVFNFTDHLGNIRLSYSDANRDNLITHDEILEENNFYPFGLKHTAYNTNERQYINNDQINELILILFPRFTGDGRYNYKYNGKEFQDELGLNFYDFGFRNYDPALGRWMNIDPLSERRYELSTYNYVQNSPLSRFDPNGLTDFTLNKKTGEVNKVGNANDEPDRILKTNSKGEVKRKGDGLFGFLVSKSERGKAKVAVDDISKNILKDGQNFKSKSNIIETGGKGQPSVNDVEKFVLQLSDYVGTEIAGTYLSFYNSKDITHMTIGRYENNTYMRATSIGLESIRTLPNARETFSKYSVKGHYHTHPNISTRFDASKADIDNRDNILKTLPNVNFYILTFPQGYGGDFPTKIDYTKSGYNY